MSCTKEIKYYLLFLACVLPFLWFDQSIMTWLREYRSANPDIDHILDQFGRAAYFAAHGTLMFAGAALIYLAGVYFKRNSVRALGKALFIGFAVSGISVQVIKHLLGRARPRITYELLFIGPTFRGSYDSFPSGHTMTAFCLAYVCSCFFPKYRIFFYIYGVFICFGRVFGGSHFPADALVGALLGLIIGRVMEKTLGLPSASGPDFRIAHKSGC